MLGNRKSGMWGITSKREYLRVGDRIPTHMFAPLEFLRKLIDAINRSVVAQLFSAAKRKQ